VTDRHFADEARLSILLAASRASSAFDAVIDTAPSPKMAADPRVVTKSALIKRLVREVWDARTEETAKVALAAGPREAQTERERADLDSLMVAAAAAAHVLVIGDDGADSAARPPWTSPRGQLSFLLPGEPKCHSLAAVTAVLAITSRLRLAGVYAIVGTTRVWLGVDDSDSRAFVDDNDLAAGDPALGKAASSLTWVDPLPPGRFLERGDANWERDTGADRVSKALVMSYGPQFGLLLLARAALPERLKLTLLTGRTPSATSSAVADRVAKSYATGVDLHIDGAAEAGLAEPDSPVVEALTDPDSPFHVDRVPVPVLIELTRCAGEVGDRQAVSFLCTAVSDAFRRSHAALGRMRPPVPTPPHINRQPMPPDYDDADANADIWPLARAERARALGGVGLRADALFEAAAAVRAAARTWAQAAATKPAFYARFAYPLARLGAAAIEHAPVTDAAALEGAVALSDALLFWHEGGRTPRATPPSPAVNILCVAARRARPPLVWRRAFASRQVDSFGIRRAARAVLSLPSSIAPSSVALEQAIAAVEEGTPDLNYLLNLQVQSLAMLADADSEQATAAAAAAAVSRTASASSVGVGASGSSLRPNLTAFAAPRGGLRELSARIASVVPPPPNNFDRDWAWRKKYASLGEGERSRDRDRLGAGAPWAERDRYSSASSDEGEGDYGYNRRRDQGKSRGGGKGSRRGRGADGAGSDDGAAGAGVSGGEEDGGVGRGKKRGRPKGSGRGGVREAERAAAAAAAAGVYGGPVGGGASTGSVGTVGVGGAGMGNGGGGRVTPRASQSKAHLAAARRALDEQAAAFQAQRAVAAGGLNLGAGDRTAATQRLPLSGGGGGSPPAAVLPPSTTTLPPQAAMLASRPGVGGGGATLPASRAPSSAPAQPVARAAPKVPALHPEQLEGMWNVTDGRGGPRPPGVPTPGSSVTLSSSKQPSRPIALSQSLGMPLTDSTPSLPAPTPTSGALAGASGKKSTPPSMSDDMRSFSPLPGIVSSTKKEELDWVACDKCDKWHVLPPGLTPDLLPDTWYCSQNDWSPEEGIGVCDPAGLAAKRRARSEANRSGRRK